MYFKQGRTCPVCFKENLFYLRDHLRQVHKLSSSERQPWLKSATYSPTKPPGLAFTPPYPFWGMNPHYPTSIQQQYLTSMNPPFPTDVPQSLKPKQSKPDSTSQCLKTKPYPEFKFHHTCSMLVVGPTQCGKTYFVQQLLTKNCLEYSSEKPTQIYWFYNQWQPRYDALKRTLKKKIQFTQGLPNLSEDLHEINPEYNNILVFDDLMSQAIDSPVLSQLFTQGRHRNASVILLLQNMFPKGKYNTDISRNAQYLVLFRSPSDRKQIGIVAERIFAKDRPNFMKAYVQETAKPHGYVVIDNQPTTSNDKQVIADVFKQCKCYPYISTQSEITPAITTAQPKVAVQHKLERPKPPVKRKRTSQKPVAKKAKRQFTKKQPRPKTQRKPKKSRKQAIYKPRFLKSPPRESSDEELLNSEEEPLSSEEHSEEFFSENEQRQFNPHDLNLCAKQSRNGFGPKFVYD